MWGIVIVIPIYFIVINGVRSVQHTNGMVWVLDVFGIIVIRGWNKQRELEKS